MESLFGEPIYRCKATEECDFTSSKSLDILNHNKNTHRAEFQCAICQFVTLDQQKIIDFDCPHDWPFHTDDGYYVTDEFFPEEEENR